VTLLESGLYTRINPASLPSAAAQIDPQGGPHLLRSNFANNWMKVDKVATIKREPSKTQMGDMTEDGI